MRTGKEIHRILCSKANVMHTANLIEKLGGEVFQVQYTLNNFMDIYFKYSEGQEFPWDVLCEGE